MLKIQSFIHILRTAQDHQLSQRHRTIFHII